MDARPAPPHPSRAPWELWILRALEPEADLARLAELKRRRRRVEELETRMYERIVTRREEYLTPGARLLRGAPELREGLVVTMHVGPYQLLPTPWLEAGIIPGVLATAAAHAQLAGPADRLARALRLEGRVEWIPIDSDFFVRRMLAVLRERRPLLVFLDGNVGVGGSARTRQDGLPYRLPGREIRVRTGLARIACRLGCPVHPVVVRWDRTGLPAWRRAPTQSWAAGDSPPEVTRLLYDWGFGEVLAAPEEWTYWNVLKESFACFERGRLTAAGLAPGLREDYRRAFETCLERAPETVRLVLDKRAEVWPGDVLANLTDDVFHAAEGLEPEQLDWLCGGRRLAEIRDRYGSSWTRFHALRLCLLDLARLAGVAP
jgi:hypothetical protein